MITIEVEIVFNPAERRTRMKTQTLNRSNFFFKNIAV